MQAIFDCPMGARRLGEGFRRQYSRRDVVDGRNGNDTLNTRGGNDTLIRGIGEDVLVGGSGADVHDVNAVAE